MDSNSQPTSLFANSPGVVVSNNPGGVLPIQPAQPIQSPAQTQPTQQIRESQVVQPSQSLPTNISADEDDLNNYEYQSIFPDYMRPTQEELIFEWRADSRPFKKHKRNFYTTGTVIVVLISLILFFSGQFLPIAVVIAVTFLAYVLTSIPPQEITYQVTTFGVRIEDKLYEWDLMNRFWFTEKYSQELVHVEVAQFPERLTLVLGATSKDIIAALFSEVLIMQTPAPTIYERVAAWLQEKIPLDLDS